MSDGGPGAMPPIFNGLLAASHCCMPVTPLVLDNPVT
jgi:hypothetical protein